METGFTSADEIRVASYDRCSNSCKGMVQVSKTICFCKRSGEKLLSWNDPHVKFVALRSNMCKQIGYELENQ